MLKRICGAAPSEAIIETNTLATPIAELALASAPGPVSRRALDEPSAVHPGCRDRSMAEQNPFGRLGRPEDVAGTVAFLASDDAAYVTGQEILVAGGAGLTV